jgi:hypothetical protein
VAEVGAEGRRRGRTVEIGGGGCGGLDSGERGARVGQQAALGALGSPRGGARGVGWL